MEGILVLLMELMVIGLIILFIYYLGILELIEYGEDGFLVLEGFFEFIVV